MPEFLMNLNIQMYLLAYLVGGIPFGLLLAKFFAKVDITQSGSQSIGATNVLRVVKEQDPALAKKLGAATLALDALKGIVVLLIGKLLGVPEATLWAMAVLAVVGHCFSPYLKLEGGKGVATGFGVLAFMLPLEAAIAVATWFIAAKTIRISSLSSTIGLIALLIASYIIHPDISHAPIWLIAFFIMYKHIPNYIRVLKGEEKRVI
jgi:glycerol-3-phosphate acyltransferase PlsY